MLKSNKQNYISPISLENSPMRSVTVCQTSEIPVKTSVVHQAGRSWVTVALGLIAIAGVLAGVGIAIVAFVILPRTTVACKSLSLSLSYSFSAHFRIATTSVTTTTTTTPTSMGCRKDSCESFLFKYNL